MMDLAREMDVTLEVIQQAGAEIMRLYQSFARIADAPADISTDADRASQEIILQRLLREFPADGMCGEEPTPTLAEAVAARAGAKRWWVIDPIDGTRGFAMKNGEFSVMIGLVAEGQVILGAVYEPAIDRLTYAYRGKGCFYQQPTCPAPGEKVGCRVTATGALGDATLSMSRSQGEKGERHLLDAFGAKAAVQTYSAGVKLAQVARGETDLYLGDYLQLKDWDICAGHILVEEAGGMVTDRAGAPLRYGSAGFTQRQGLLATNGPLHAHALAVLADGKVVLK